jgi:uncharacterized protein (TIGR03905 family)
MIRKYVYQPHDVCSNNFEFMIEDDTIKAVKITGGCPGNLVGISNIMIGMKVDDVIERFRGVKCGQRITSCPDQIALALADYLQTIKA